MFEECLILTFHYKPRNRYNRYIVLHIATLVIKIESKEGARGQDKFR